LIQISVAQVAISITVGIQLAVAARIKEQRADVLTPHVIFILRSCSYLFYPILVVFSFLARLLGRVLGGNKESRNPFTLREEIKALIQMPASEGDIEPMEQDMIRRLFNFGETTAREVMMPLIDLAVIEQGASCAEARKVAIKHSHARIPVYQERVDRIIGVLDTLELLGIPADEPIQSFIKPISYVPVGKSIQELLLDMRQAGEQVSVVVDEFGGAEGIVSIEDILEEVVEDIQDEYDVAEPEIQMIKRLDDGTLLVNARIDLDDLGEELDVELPKGRYASLAGFLMEKAGEIPQVGSHIKYQKLRFTVMRGSAQSIEEVKIS
jgi:putative hemolysin